MQAFTKHKENFTFFKAASFEHDLLRSHLTVIVLNKYRLFMMIMVVKLNLYIHLMKNPFALHSFWFYVKIWSLGMNDQKSDVDMYSYIYHTKTRIPQHDQQGCGVHNAQKIGKRCQIKESKDKHSCISMTSFRQTVTEIMISRLFNYNLMQNWSYIVATILNINCGCYFS